MSLTAHLLEQVLAATADLPQITQQRMFGCEVVGLRGRAFALIWNSRIGVKLSDPAAFDELNAMPGTGRWTLSTRTAVSRWLLVPESFHDDEDSLRLWVRRAHALALAEPPKVKKKPAPAKKKRPVR